MGVGAGSNLGDNVTFVAFANVDPTRHPATLLPGVPMAGLAGPGETLQFEVTVPTGGPFTADVTPLQGDPDLYASCSWAPGPSQFTWQSSTTGIDSLTVQPSDARFCANGTFFVGVYGFRAASKFVLTASDDQLRPIELEPNVPVEVRQRARLRRPSCAAAPLTRRVRQTTVEQDTYMFFETHLPDADSDLFIDVSPVTGNPVSRASGVVGCAGGADGARASRPASRALVMTGRLHELLLRRLSDLEQAHVGVDQPREFRCCGAVAVALDTHTRTDA